MDYDVTSFRNKKPIITDYNRLESVFIQKLSSLHFALFSFCFVCFSVRFFSYCLLFTFSWIFFLLFTVYFLNVYCKNGIWRGWTPFFRDSTPCLPKGFPLCTVLRYSYLVMDPLAFGAKKKLILKGIARQKNAISW